MRLPFVEAVFYVLSREACRPMEWLMDFEIPETLANKLLERINENTPLSKRLAESGKYRGRSLVSSSLFEQADLDALQGLYRFLCAFTY